MTSLSHSHVYIYYTAVNFMHKIKDIIPSPYCAHTMLLNPPLQRTQQSI